ncbi:CHAT domain-containing protein [Bradyrhizobium prioriisuperbiae]|uniref:CHAT domain-containing protein n=1 Tax=Bradyrhizobium prioriisuperbiae TaxID=2854389 RepID=UPI0028E4AAD8|nr:CHAT domain-containing protein [Bradyrhizobium prioritasuperba]
MARHKPIRAREFLRSDQTTDSDDEWRYAVEKLHRLQDLVFEIMVERADELIVISGNVASEQVKRLIAEILTDYDPKAQLSNELEVTAPFRSAEDDDFTIEMKGGLTLDAITPAPIISVERYPSFSSNEKPAVGRKFQFEVDLSTIQGGREAIKFDLPSDWQMVAIDVDVYSAQLVMEEKMKRRKVALFEDGRSLPARFQGEVVGVTEEGTVDVLVKFTCEGRASGMARVSFKVEEGNETEVAGSSPAQLGVAAMNAQVRATPPDMTISIYKAGPPTSWIWMVDAPHTQNLGAAQRHGTIDMPDPEAFATELLKQCPTLTKPRHASRLRGIGEQIWARAPEMFRLLYKDMREKFGPRFSIQIMTEEPHVPWEMMFPDGQSGIQNPDHLFMTHPICRWSATYARDMRPQIESGSIASFVPNYPGGQALPAAIAEGRWLVSSLGARAMDPTWDSFTKFWTTDLPKERVAVLHFAGHGENKPDPRIRMLDAYVSRDDVNGAVKLGSRDGTFVVLNACEVGTADMRLGLASGWTERLIKHSFGGVLAPLWKVEDDCASEAVRTYLGKFCRGMPMGMALLQARKAQRDQSATPYAYICHGDVNATMR